MAAVAASCSAGREGATPCRPRASCWHPPQKMSYRKFPVEPLSELEGATMPCSSSNSSPHGLRAGARRAPVCRFCRCRRCRGVPAQRTRKAPHLEVQEGQQGKCSQVAHAQQGPKVLIHQPRVDPAGPAAHPGKWQLRARAGSSGQGRGEALGGGLVGCQHPQQHPECRGCACHHMHTRRCDATAQRAGPGSVLADACAPRRRRSHATHDQAPKKMSSVSR
jgi:hypothetical protein